MKNQYLSESMLKIKETGLFPVLDPFRDIDKVAGSLFRAGVQAIELTPGEHTAECLKNLILCESATCVGVQGINSASDAVSLIDAGAQWIGTPGICTEVATICADRGIDCIPTITSASDVVNASRAGLHVVRFSAAGVSPSDISALYDAVGDVNYILTSVARDQIHQYLDLPCVIALSDRYISLSQILLEDWGGIEIHMTNEMLYMLDFHIGHVGFNTGSPENGKAIADRLEQLFGFEQHPGSVNIFADEKFGLLTIVDAPGVHGHIQMLCSSVERGRIFLERIGTVFADTAKFLPMGSFSAVLEETCEYVIAAKDWDIEYSAISPNKYAFLHYLEEQIGGFAFHLGREFYNDRSGH